MYILLNDKHPIHKAFKTVNNVH